jgi:hypothetical protein
MGAALHMTPADLQTLSALQRLAFLSITQVPLCYEECVRLLTARCCCMLEMDVKTSPAGVPYLQFYTHKSIAYELLTFKRQTHEVRMLLCSRDVPTSAMGQRLLRCGLGASIRSRTCATSSGSCGCVQLTQAACRRHAGSSLPACNLLHIASIMNPT